MTGSGSNRLFAVPADVNVTFRGLILSGGSVTGTNGTLDQYGGPAEGGAIFNAGNLVLDSCVISNNVSTAEWVARSLPTPLPVVRTPPSQCAVNSSLADRVVGARSSTWVAFG